MKERVKWVDCWRLLAIFSIYLFHFGDAAGKAYLFADLYHIKLFFFISGFFFAGVAGAEELRKRLIKIVFRVGVPTLLFVLINVAFLTVVNRYSIDKVISVLQVYIGMKKGSGIGGLWFLGCFFFLSVLHLVVSYLVKNKYLVFALALALYLYIGFANPFKLTEHLFASIDLIPQFWVFYSLGSVVFPLLQKMDTSGTTQSEILRAGLLILTGIYAGMCFSGGSYVSYGSAVIFNFAGAIILILFFTIIAQYISKLLRDSSIILKIGRATFVLCATENMTKRIVADILSAAGAEIEISTPITAAIFTVIYLLFGYLLWFRCVAGIFPILSGHYSPKQKLKTDKK